MRGARGVWGWLLQRVTAVGLAVVLTVHLYVLHFAGEHAVLTVADVSVRLRTLTFILVDFGLLAFALYHGLYGLRSVILDYTTRESTVRAVTVGLWALGLIAFVYGALALLLLIKG
jgi:succinate dehydrogenase / fumarate reductase membrane anchor subunit